MTDRASPDTRRASAPPLGAWLADLADPALVALLAARPDLTQPPPGSLAALAARAQSRQSVKATTDDLDFRALAVLDALVTLHADTDVVSGETLRARLPGPLTDPELEATLAVLRDRALLWGADALRIGPETAVGLPWYPGQVTVEDDAADPALLAARLAEVSGPQRELLDRLSQALPVGRTRDAAPDAPADRPAAQLLAAGLLRRLDDDTVILPRLVGQLLRGETAGPRYLQPPDPVVGGLAAADADAAAAGAALDLLREVELLIETLGRVPAGELRNGGLGVRDTRRLAKVTGIDETRLGLLLEVMSGAGLIASGFPETDGQDAAVWAPTVAADRFVETPAAQRWLLLVQTWLELPARPGLIGERGPDGKVFAALSDALFSTAAPLDRRLLLDTLAELPAGAGVDAASASAALIWRRPRGAARLQPAPVGALLEEARTLGVLGRGALATPLRALAAGEPENVVATRMTAVLPDPIDHFLLQADLTVVVPGPLDRGLAEELAAVATVESAGAAMVYRVGEASIRHALDTGRTAAQLHAFFARHSRTPVPQGLTYLVDDVARRHGRLRVGTAASFVRCEDPALLAQAVAAPACEVLALRVLAPTVAISQLPIGNALAALRTAGFTPAAEDSAGAVVDLRARAARVAVAGQRRSYRPPTAPSAQTLGAIVAVLRRAAAAPVPSRLDPAAAMVQLQDAATGQTSVVIGYVDPAGVATQRVVAPISVRGGQLTAFDPAAGRVREFAIHRVTSVVSADPG